MSEEVTAETRTPVPGRRRRVDVVAGLAIVVVWAGVLTEALLGSTVLRPFAYVALGTFVLCQLPSVRWPVWLHLAIGALIAGVAATQLQAPLEAFTVAMGRAALLAALLASLGMLREAACMSESVLRGGRMLVTQPPGRRYLAISGGSTLFGAILNFGAVGLLGGIVQSVNTLASARGLEEVRKLREKRMMLAVLRGFSLCMFWCPLTIAYAVVIAIVPGVSWPLMVGIGALISVLCLALGWAVDRYTMPRAGTETQWQAFTWKPLLPLLGIVLLVSALAASVEALSGGLLIHGVILVVPLVAAIWIGLQQRIAAPGARLARYVRDAVPAQRVELIVLGNAAFLGVLVSYLVAETPIRDLMATGHVPGFAIPLLIPWLVVLAGQLNMNPLISVTVLGAIVGGPTDVGVPPEVLATAFVLGWGLTVGSSPVAATTLIIGRTLGIRSRVIGRGWNGQFTVLALILCSLCLLVLELVA